MGTREDIDGVEIDEGMCGPLSKRVALVDAYKRSCTNAWKVYQQKSEAKPRF